MTREQQYREQMKALGIYDPAFEPEISMLAQIEREHRLAKKAWSKSAPANGKPSILDPHYAVIQRLRAEMLQHREALGLTPKALRKLRGPAPEGPGSKELITDALDRIAERVSGYGSMPAADPEELQRRLAEAGLGPDIEDDLRQGVHEDMGLLPT